MPKGPCFIEREVFEETLREVPKLRGGGEYQDLEVAYGDMSRLVVGLIARTPMKELKSLYLELGWGGDDVNVRQMHMAARRWYEKWHPELIDKVWRGTAE